MADFDEKLNNILSNPDAMAQIMQLAQSLGGGQDQGVPSEQASPPSLQSQSGQSPSWLGQSGPPPYQQPQSGPDVLTGLSGLTGGMDPKLLLRLLPLIQELGSGQDSNARQLLYALRPYLKTERQEKVERALQLARLFHLGKKFLTEWEG